MQNLIDQCCREVQREMIFVKTNPNFFTKIRHRVCLTFSNWHFEVFPLAAGRKISKKILRIELAN